MVVRNRWARVTNPLFKKRQTAHTSEELATKLFSLFAPPSSKLGRNLFHKEEPLFSTIAWSCDPATVLVDINLSRPSNREKTEN